MRIYLSHFVFLAVLVCVFCKNGWVRHRYYWRDYRGVLPNDAFNVTEFLYIGQVLYDSILIGGYYAGTGAVLTEYDGRRMVVRDGIKLLCDRRPDQNFQWEPAKTYTFTPRNLQNLVIGGFENGVVTYVGRAFHEGQWKIGNVFPPPYPLEGLHVWGNDGSGYIIYEFDILKYLDRAE